MSQSQEHGSERRFTPAVLPWVVAGVIFIIYLVTLNHWVSMGSLGNVATVSGWNWQPSVDGPLFWLVTLPFRWLPAKYIPVALNLFAAVCASLALALLARSVALLPHDRTEAQRLRERSPFRLLSIPSAWAPPIFAALLCGLQLTFWQHATVASREMFDLLLFAYVIRCLLEFHISGRDSWLLKSALIYGAAMAENWAMIGFFPLFLVALVWMKGVAFFDGKFLSRMFLLGSIGLLTYLVLPLVDSLTSVVPVSFWQALKLNLGSQKQMLLALPFSKGALMHGFTGDQPLWVLALPSLLPVLAMCIRWPAYAGGDVSKVGIALTRLTFHILYGVLFALCVWVALDPEKFSPRHLLDLPFLTLYYLGALSAGYYLGYFLLVFGNAKPLRGGRPVPSAPPLVKFAVTAIVWLLVLSAPAVLLYRNLPQVRTTNGPMWRQYADRLIEPLPAQGGVIMSDDWTHLMLVEAALAQKGRGNEFLFLHTGPLRQWSLYHKYLAHRYPHRWPASPPPLVPDGPDAGKVNTIYLIQLAYKMAETNSTWYLHPSFGYYFEAFYPEAHDLIYRLQPYPANALTPPACGSELLRANEEFWTQTDPALNPLVASVQAASPEVRRNWIDNLLKKAHLVKEPNPDAQVLAALYSRALVDWGVTMQRNGQLKKAEAHFTRALDLNPENVVAQIDLECNRTLQAGSKTVIDLPKSAEERLLKYRTRQDAMNANGPFDEPTFCFQQGRDFLQGGNYRQAGQEFTRVTQLVPDNLPSRLLLAQIYLFSRMPEPALALVDEIHRRVPASQFDRTNELELLSVETVARLARSDLAGADAAVQKVLRKYPGDEEFMGLAVRNFMNFGCYTNALTLLDRELERSPNNPSALVNKGLALLRLNRFAEAVPTLSQAISLETTNFTGLHYAALLNRAIAYLHLDQLDKSREDYLELQRALPTDYRLDYGLGELAYRQKDTNSAVRAYENYMNHAPTNSPEIQNETALVVARLKELKPSRRQTAAGGGSDAAPATGANQGKSGK